MSKKKIIILDDHSLFLKGMTLILKECCYGCKVKTYQSIRELELDSVKLEDYNLLISDIELPGEDIFTFFKKIKASHPTFPILVVSMHKKIAVIKKCKALGIEGYLLKDEDDQLTKAIEVILNGKMYYSESIVGFCQESKIKYKKLSSREETIIILIAKGVGNQGIAEKLSVSVETIKTHKKNIRMKLDVDSISEIIEYAKHNFLI